jgi:hypothetical protein
MIYDDLNWMNGELNNLGRITARGFLEKLELRTFAGVSGRVSNIV